MNQKSMKLPIKLQDLLQQNETAIIAYSTLIGQGQFLIDCTDVESVSPEILTLLFTNIPETWDFVQLGEIFATSTLTDTFAKQLCEWVNQRLGKTPTETPEISVKSDSKNLDIFSFRNEVIGDYRRYIESFLKIRDPQVKEFVDRELEKGQLWTDPLVQLNPSYRKGGTVTELIQQGTLHPDCAKYFSKNGQPYRFHYHQQQAFETAKRLQPYVLTTGTGSGKSMTYLVPIFNDLLHHPEIKGVRAILVYPMNALINSQKEEFDKFLEQVPNTHIRVEQYTGQESLAKKSEIQENPPQILLTNYVMLELMLSRTHENKLVASPDLKFLILDELHTYRGRQGADVAILIRKLRQRCGKNLLCIGTSATMSTGGTRQHRRQVVAEVASKLFGVEVKPNNVIDETLERSIQRSHPDVSELREALLAGLPPESEQTLETFKSHPLAAWIEMNFGLAEEEGYLVRRTPISLEEGAEKLAEEALKRNYVPECLRVLKEMFLWGSKTKGLAFRLHQFISQGGSVYATIENRDTRTLTLEGQYTTTGDRLLYPLVFCRECGQDYYVVRYDVDNQNVLPQLPTALDTSLEDTDIQEGYLTLDEPGLWDTNDEDRLPDTWFNETKRKGRVPKKEYAKFIPQKLHILANGKVTTSLLEGTPGWFAPRPFLTCLNCGVVHDARKNEFTKLSRLSSEGRSTATTLLCLSTVSRLKEVLTGEQAKAAKVLSFTDNRQDASLQAGHFNDFVQTSFLRAALNQALQANQQLTHSQFASEVVKHMELSQADYAKQSAEFGAGKRRNEEAFRNLVEYRLYEDLRRGWRIVQPNLEQCGLLAIEYDSLQQTCADNTLWQKYPHSILLQATPSQRCIAAQALLNHLRRELAIDAALLQPDRRDQLRREVCQAIREPWTFDDNEQLHEATWATTASGGNEQAKVKLTFRSKVGRFLRSPKAWPWRSEPLTDKEYARLIDALVNALSDAGYLLNEGNLVQLRVDSLFWKATKVNQISPDLLTSRRLQGEAEKTITVNSFFQDFYQTNARKIQIMEGREHTGQVSNKDRQEREDKFREGQLAALFCSPTMELGIDISDLSVVHLRNVPPSPANYAQRSGRAGRSGQEALVITYTSVGSSHDQYFFKRQNQMVAGVVVPPKLELANQDLIESHIYSIWLAYTGLYLGESMNQILDLDLQDYPLKENVRSQLTLTSTKLTECLHATQSILSDTFCQSDLQRASWYSVDWLRHTLENALVTFERKCDRWRRLYSDAVIQLEEARRTIDRSARGDITQEQRIIAEAQSREAQRQKDLLTGQINTNRSKNDLEFYPYRYLAAEGFLPGYNFPRLPVRAYVPAGDAGEFISRPRTVALREFAPSNIVYYEGNKFQIAKTKVPASGIESQYKRVSICFSCGYLHEGDFRDTCANCGAQISPDRYGNIAKLSRLLSMKTMITRRRERITCDEEERLKYGYNITTHFRYDSQKQDTAIVQTAKGIELLKLTYGATAKIWRINRGLKKNLQERGFKLDTKTGQWGDPKNEQNTENLQTEINLMVEDTCNILVVEPLLVPDENRESFITTFQYALETAIQAVYKLEVDELDSERLGNGKYLLFWESAEGGAGVLSQLLEDSQAFQKIADAALDICHFKHQKDTCVQACYECLLSYRNQFDHPLLNRHLIKPLLDELLTSTVHFHTGGVSRDRQYQELQQKTDPNSEFERIVLNEIYQRGIKLPDVAQELIPEANSKPDFIYKSQKIAVFCDGSAHDHSDLQKRDRVERDNLKYNASYTVLTLRYDENWQDKLGILVGLLG
ncbi:DEAD/DEAH box helicase [Aerosakkonemataceae cyanobacterium BLCC-F167]|uniref:DEAD/DEAH box helicase n=2 Tax=Floridanema TaxID=3396149 RepID=A0ABV4WDV7_9CYAN